MGRIVVLVLLVVLVAWLLRRAFGRGHASREPRTPPPDSGELVRCARCGVHLPRAEARSADGLSFCSEEHARQGPAEPG